MRRGRWGDLCGRQAECLILWTRKVQHTQPVGPGPCAWFKEDPKQRSIMGPIESNRTENTHAHTPTPHTHTHTHSDTHIHTHTHTHTISLSLSNFFQLIYGLLYHKYLFQSHKSMTMSTVLLYLAFSVCDFMNNVGKCGKGSFCFWLIKSEPTMAAAKGAKF